MTRGEQIKSRQEALSAIKLIVRGSCGTNLPSYKRAAAELNTQQVKTTWGNEWTPKRLLRFLQRMGYSGLHGVHAELNGRPKKLW